jgi:hypothetical protein
MPSLNLLEHVLDSAAILQYDLFSRCYPYCWYFSSILLPSNPFFFSRFSFFLPLHQTDPLKHTQTAVLLLRIDDIVSGSKKKDALDNKAGGGPVQSAQPTEESMKED